MVATAAMHTMPRAAVGKISVVLMLRTSPNSSE